MNNERNNTTAGGIGFCGLLAVAFIVLKLTGVINWSWLWVLAPIWIPTAITLAIIVIVLVAILASPRASTIPSAAPARRWPPARHTGSPPTSWS